MSAREDSGSGAGIAAMLGGGAIMYVGTAMATTLFGVLGPAGVTLARQVVMLVTHGSLAILNPVRPTARQVLLSMGFGVALGCMNLTFYLAIARIPLGTAVTLEFLGPIAVAVIGFRTRLAAVCSLVTAVGVIGLARPTGTADTAGILFALAAAVSWAAYIHANQAVGRRLPGFTGSAIAAITSVTLVAPFALPGIVWNEVTWQVIGLAALVGLLSSAIPYALDTFSLRRLSAPLYASLLGSYPILATLSGVLLLGDAIGVVEVVATAAIVGAGVTVVRADRASRRRGEEPTTPTD